MDYKLLSEKLGVKEAVLRAVVDVESSGDGFLPNGEVKILFEPHVFWRRLLKRKIDPKKFQKGNEDILYPTFQTGKYGKISEQHTRLNRAIKINREAALESASFGAFQILSEAWKEMKYNSVEEFVESANTEIGQVEMFTRFLSMKKLIPYLQKLNFTEFSKKYNGSAYFKNDYPAKLKGAYELWEAKLNK